MENNTFRYNYSAARNEEVEKIRKKYMPKEENLFEIRKQVGIVFQNPDNQTVASIVEDDVAFGPENIGVAPEVALANKDLLKILVDAEKNKLNYNRYIYKANMDLEIANRRNELMKYGYDANNATKLAVADVMARANMYGADTRLLGNYGMFGANVPQEIINYMTTGTLPTQGGIQNVQQQPTQVQPITLKEASQRIGRTY